MSTKEDGKRKPSLYMTHGLYYFKTNENGRRVSIATGTSNRESAELFRDRYLSKKDEVLVGKPKTLFDLIKVFMIPELNPKYLESQITNTHYTFRYAKMEKMRASHLLEIIPGSMLNKQLARLSRDDCYAIQKLVHDRYGNTAVAKATFVTMKNLLAYAFDKGITQSNLAFGMKNIKVETSEEFRVISREDALTIYHTPRCFRSEKEHDLFYILMTTGMRRGEISALQIKQIKKAKYRDRIFYLINIDQAFKDDKFSILGKPKWELERTIPIAESTAMILLKYKDSEEEFPFMLKPTEWMNMFKFIRANVPMDLIDDPDAIKVLSPHKLRHCLNTSLVKSDINATFIQEYMSWHHQNHDASAMQARYTNLYAKDLLPVADKIEEIFNVPPEHIEDEVEILEL